MKNYFLFAIAILILIGLQVNIKCGELRELSREEFKLIDKYLARGLTDSVKQILEQNVDITGRFGIKLLNNVVFRSNKELLQLLIKKGANINAIDNDTGYTALMIATMKDTSPDKSIIKLLLENGANPNTVKSDQTASDIATEFGLKSQNISKQYSSTANLLKEWEEKYKKDYKEYLNKWRSTSAAILTTSILPLLQKLVNEGRMTQEEFNEIKKGLRPIPQDVVKLIHKQSESTFDEWFKNRRKK